MEGKDREQITPGIITVHSHQGVTAGTPYGLIHTAGSITAFKYRLPFVCLCMCALFFLTV